MIKIIGLKEMQGNIYSNLICFSVSSLIQRNQIDWWQSLLAETINLFTFAKLKIENMQIHAHYIHTCIFILGIDLC